VGEWVSARAYYIIIIIIYIYPLRRQRVSSTERIFYFIFLELFANWFIGVSFVNIRDSMLLYIRTRYIIIYPKSCLREISKRVPILFSK